MGGIESEKKPKRRRKENKTDYLKRLKLLKSERARIVFRKTNKYIISEYVKSEDAQDKVIFGFDSKSLMIMDGIRKHKEV